MDMRDLAREMYGKLLDIPCEHDDKAAGGLCEAARAFEEMAERASELRELARERIGWTGCE